MRSAWLLAFVMSCTTIHVPPKTDIRAAQRRAIDERIGFIHDSLPVVRFDPPFVYHMLKAQVEACSGRHKAGFPELYLAPISPLDRSYAIAVFLPRENKIVFSLGSEVMQWVIRHELLHWLLAPEDTKKHPAVWFSTDPTIGKCAAFITEG